MGLRRSISWDAALRDLKSDRAVRADVREERCSNGLSAWRGLSGKRYIFSPLASTDFVREPLVLIALRRNAGSAATLINVEAIESGVSAANFRRLAAMTGATEVQAYRLADTDGARAVVARDLISAAVSVGDSIICGALAVAGRFVRSVIMATAIKAARARRALTGEAWGVCLSAALKGAWRIAKAARIATQN